MKYAEAVWDDEQDWQYCEQDWLAAQHVDGIDVQDIAKEDPYLSAVWTGFEDVVEHGRRLLRRRRCNLVSW